MKRTLLLILSLFLAMPLFGQKEIFEAPNMKQDVANQHIVAILPFDVHISYKRVPKNFSADENSSKEQKMSEDIQSSLYTFLLRKGDGYTVTFQDVDKTNTLLKRANVFNTLDQMTKDEIAKILGVDAVIDGEFELENTKTEGGAIASAVLFGGFGGKTGSGSFTMTINNGNDGELLWRYFNNKSSSIMSSTDDLVERIMRKVARNFPYKE